MYDDQENESDRIELLAIFKKGYEILEVVRQIADLISDDDDHLNHIKQFMLEDAHMLTAKVAAAEGGDLYDIRMENAAIIRKSAQSLMLYNHSLEMLGFEHVEYYSIVRNLIEEYRLLFIDWVAGFDKWNYITDRWGLFNPPGVGPFDIDPNDPFFDNDEDEF
ncbi:MAG: hypothetical protein PHS84_12530 [Paludibacter sp.]|nr:hypothetical protein [Paludibacter sp.]